MVSLSLEKVFIKAKQVCHIYTGEKDEAPMLYCGEKIGDGNPPSVEIAVDPLDGTSLTAQGTVYNGIRRQAM